MVARAVAVEMAQNIVDVVVSLMVAVAVDTVDSHYCFDWDSSSGDAVLVATVPCSVMMVAVAVVVSIVVRPQHHHCPYRIGSNCSDASCDDDQDHDPLGDNRLRPVD